VGDGVSDSGCGVSHGFGLVELDDRAFDGHGAVGGEGEVGGGFDRTRTHGFGPLAIAQPQAKIPTKTSTNS
jgi:hypothetical protein